MTAKTLTMNNKYCVLIRRIKKHNNKMITKLNINHNNFLNIAELKAENKELSEIVKRCSGGECYQCDDDNMPRQLMKQIKQLEAEKELEEEAELDRQQKNAINYRINKTESCCNCAFSIYDCPEEAEGLRCKLLTKNEGIIFNNYVNTMGICDNYTIKE